jgi:phosphatidylinositol alpha-1,6-mannosyltransferase
MRILFVTDKFIPERGGSQIIFGQLYSHLRDHEVTVLTKEWPGAAECDAAYPHRVIRLPFSRIPKVRSPLLWLDLAREANRLLRSEQFDQVHCGQTVETAPAGAWLAERRGIPLLVHTFAEDVTTYLRHPFYGPLMRRGLKAASVVTSISQFTVEHLRRLGVPERRVVLLYPGVTPEVWNSRGGEAGVRDRFDLHGKKVILTISRLIPRKGQDTVLKALPAVLRSVPDAVYLIVGGGPEEARLRNLAHELGVEGSVRFVGSIPNVDTVDYYHASDLFVMPNRQMPNGDIEGFGLVFLEANVCGKPVIGGRSGGAVDAIAHGESGYLVDPTDPADVAARLTELLQDSGRAAQLGAAGRERVLREFTWDRSGGVLHHASELASKLHRPPVAP